MHFEKLINNNKNIEKKGQKEGIVVMKRQLKLCSVLDHDIEPVQEKKRKKISQVEIKKRGDFIADKSKDGVKKILENIRRKDTSLDKWQLKKG